VRHLATTAAVLAGALALAGCRSSGSDDAGSGGSDGTELSVGSSYMPQPVTDSMAAGFLVITNKGGSKDELSSVTSDLAEDVTVHKTVGSSMEEVKQLAIPAHGQLTFQSGGNHLMFEKLKHRPKQGEKVSVRLHFTKSDPITVEMPVKSPTYSPKTGH